VDWKIQKKIMDLGSRLRLTPPLVMICLILGTGMALAQVPPPPQLPADTAPDALAAPVGAGLGAGPGNKVLKIGFLAFDQFSYKVHPFRTLTGDTQFDQNIAAGGSSGSFGTPDTDGDENFFNRALHSLPPFRLDYSWSLPFRFPGGIGVGVDYMHLSQTDVNAVEGTLDLTNLGARITMDTYVLSLPVRLYGFDPSQPGINFFFGLSLGFLNGNLLALDETGSGTDVIIPFSESPVGATRMGIEVMGESFGGRFELTMLNASNVEFDSNPFPNGGGVTTVDMSGTALQLTMLWMLK
jgi:hypothetical protein